jgi:type IX secretion system PorP/SprF family membrane protein
MIKAKYLFFLASFICFTFLATAQDIHFSQFWMAPLIQNPAMAGAEYDMQAGLNYKDQWKSVETPYKTINASYDMALSKQDKKDGFWAGGINVFSDKAGDSEMGTLQANLSFAYHLYISDKSKLGLGVMGGFVQRSINYSSLKWGSQYNGYNYDSSLPAGEPLGVTSISYVDLGTGLVWTYDKGEKYMTGNDQVKATAGVAVFHPHQPDYSFYKTGEKLNMKYVAHANVLIGVGNSLLSIVPGFIYYRQGSASELLAGSMFRYLLKAESQYTGFITGSALSFGAHFRTRDAFIASMLLEMGSYSLGVSYDLNTSDLNTASSGRGGIEISLRFLNPNPFLSKSSKRY